MDQEKLCQHLEELLQQLDVTIRYENLNTTAFFSTGGLCKVKGKLYLIIDKSCSAADCVRLFTDTLKTMDLEGVYVKPAIRDILKGC